MTESIDPATDEVVDESRDEDAPGDTIDAIETVEAKNVLDAEDPEDAERVKSSEGSEGAESVARQASDEGAEEPSEAMSSMLADLFDEGETQRIADDLLMNIVEGALFASDQALTVDRLLQLFEDHERPHRDRVKSALVELTERYSERALNLVETASGYRFRVSAEVGPWVARLSEEKPQRYSRATLETLALIAYRQPITRGEIEDIRGVSVSSHIIKSMQERDWIRVVGHRDVPGRPAMYATTREFLDYFNLRNLDELPSLAEIRDLDAIAKEVEGRVEDGREDTPQAETEAEQLALMDGELGEAQNADVESDEQSKETVTDDVSDELSESVSLSADCEGDAHANDVSPVPLDEEAIAESEGVMSEGIGSESEIEDDAVVLSDDDIERKPSFGGLLSSFDKRLEEAGESENISEDSEDEAIETNASDGEQPS